MWSKTYAALALSQLLALPARAQWPSSYDEIEDLMVLQSGTNSRGFANIVTPCSNVGAPGFLNSASFIRTAFHDMAAYDASSGTNGMDASIGYELHDDFLIHNTGPGFGAILGYISTFYNEKASMADLIALGVYASVRSCGGPQIPMRAGRVDASGAGPNALPDAADSLETFQQRFAKMGFNNREMVELTACGHTVGGVHAQINTAIAQGFAAAKASGAKPPRPGRFRRQDQQQFQLLPFDSTPDKFDNLDLTEYVQGTTQNPLIIGNETLRADLRIYQSDNDIITQMASSNDLFFGSCQNVLQKMIECVPKNVQLSDIIQTYTVKPGRLNLNVGDNGQTVTLSGEIRVRTNSLDASSVQVVAKDHSGNVCSDCTVDASFIGNAAGFDDQFSWFGFSVKSASISSFNVIVGGQTYNNGGNGFPVNDNAFVQSSSSSNDKIVVAVRANQQGTPDVTITSKSGFQLDSLPKLSKNSLSVSQICTDSNWAYYAATGNIDTSGTINVALGGKVVDGFRSVSFPDSPVEVICGSATTTTTTTESTTTTTSDATTTTEATTTTDSTTTTESTTTSGSTSDGTSTSTSSGSTSSGSTSIGSSVSTTTTTTKKGSTLTTTTTKSSGTTKNGPSVTTKSGTWTSKSGSWTTTSKGGKPTSWAPPPAWTVYQPPQKTTKGWGVTTVTALTTYCPYPTKITTNGKTYTVTKATTLIITDCPCTVPVKTTGYGKPDGAYPTGGYGGDYNGDKGAIILSSLFNVGWDKPAPSGGTDGGNKNVEGLVGIVIVSVTVKPTVVYASTIAPQGTGPAWTGANVPAPTTPVSPQQTWAPVTPVAPSSTWAAVPVAPYKGAANAMAVPMMGAAAVIGALAMIM